MDYFRTASVLSLLSITLFFPLRASATSCPAGTPPNPTANTTVDPQTALLGQNVTVTIDTSVTGPLTVCLNDTLIGNFNPATPGESGKTKIEFALPANPSTIPASCDLILSLVAHGTAYLTSIKIGPHLDSVTSVPLGPENDTFRVRFNGLGFCPFDKQSIVPDKIQVQLNSFPLQVSSWTQSNWTPSNCPLRTVCGYVAPNGGVIELAGIDPLEERSALFKIWINGVRSDVEQNDSSATQQYWLAIGVSAITAVALIGVVVLLVAKYLRPVAIEGDTYVVRALFLDKETNTYSLSKFQFYIWTLVAVFGYVYLMVAKNWFQHYLVLPPIPSGLPGIVAIAGGTAVGAQIITNMNGPKGAGQLKPSLSDFVTSGDTVAAERVQFFVWTIIGALGFLMVIFRLDPRVIRDLPEVPASILSISGLSAFGYLGGKLARNPGPVVTEAMVSIGPDPDTNTAAIGSPVRPSSGIVPPAKSSLSAIKQNLQAISPSPTVQAVVVAATKSCDAAASAIQTVEASINPAAISTQVEKAVADASAGSQDAALAVSSLPPSTPSADSDDAKTAASLAQQAAKVAQDVLAALKLSTTPLAPAAVEAASYGNFGRIELRGRMLSCDGNFRVSRREENDADDLDISFDQLQPSQLDDKPLKKPRVIERDSDSTDQDMAKRLLLVINLNESLRQVFAGGSKHTITIINPDSQKALFKFQVPESQKPV
jgi:hypothetical protein